jgi:predicted dehydrogenase
MNHIVGETPVRVYASGAMDVNHLEERYDGEQPDIIDNAYTVIDYADGTRAMLDLCMFAEQSRHQTEIVVSGAAGQVEVAQPEGVLWVGERERPIHPGVRRDSRRLTATEVPVEETALAAGTPAEVSLRDGLIAVAIGEAGERSIAEGRPVEIAEVLGE